MIYDRIRLRGSSEKLYPGHDGGFDLRRIRSFQFIECNDCRENHNRNLCG